MERLSTNGERLEKPGRALVLRELVTVEQAPDGLGLLREESWVSGDADVAKRSDLRRSNLTIGGGLGHPEGALSSVDGHAAGWISTCGRNKSRADDRLPRTWGELKTLDER